MDRMDARTRAVVLYELSTVVHKWPIGKLITYCMQQKKARENSHTAYRHEGSIYDLTPLELSNLAGRYYMSNLKTLSFEQLKKLWETTKHSIHYGGEWCTKTFQEKETSRVDTELAKLNKQIQEFIEQTKEFTSESTKITSTSNAVSLREKRIEYRRRELTAGQNPDKLKSPGERRKRLEQKRKEDNEKIIRQLKKPGQKPITSSVRNTPSKVLEFPNLKGRPEA